MKDGMLEFKDAPMFGRVMRDPEICKGVLERVLGFEVEHIEYLNTEQVLDPATDAKGVRLDVFVRNSEHVFDIEMQVAHDLELGKRLRYYQASLDQASLDKGTHYELLEESYVIFICDFDPYGFGLPAYRLERRCMEQGRVDVRDRSHWLVLNASAWSKDEVAARASLLEYVHTGAWPEDDLIRQIDASVQSANQDREWRRSAMGFMTVEHDHRARMYAATRRGLEQGRTEGLAKGRERGLEEGRQEGRTEGRQQGEQAFASLADKLLDAGRVDDLKRATHDERFRQSLFEEFHIG